MPKRTKKEDWTIHECHVPWDNPKNGPVTDWSTLAEEEKQKIMEKTVCRAFLRNGYRLLSADEAAEYRKTLEPCH